jgi:hypothetical protein
MWMEAAVLSVLGWRDLENHEKSLNVWTSTKTDAFL